jgi:hypothetical protein
MAVWEARLVHPTRTIRGATSQGRQSRERRQEVAMRNERAYRGGSETRIQSAMTSPVTYRIRMGTKGRFMTSSLQTGAPGGRVTLTTPAL